MSHLTVLVLVANAIEKQVKDLIKERDELKFADIAVRQDRDELVKRVDRQRFEYTFQTPSGAQQVVTVYKVPSVGYYAPILGSTSPTYTELPPLISRLATAFAPGTQHIKTRDMGYE